MTDQKRFGIWMDSHQATIVGKENPDSSMIIIARTKGQLVTHHTSEKHEHNDQKMVHAKFFKEIISHLQNATYIHITGTGQAQEQFIHFLAGTAQFKNVKTEESTSNKMNDESLLAFFAEKLN